MLFLHANEFYAQILSIDQWRLVRNKCKSCFPLHKLFATVIDDYVFYILALMMVGDGTKLPKRGACFLMLRNHT